MVSFNPLAGIFVCDLKEIDKPFFDQESLCFNPLAGIFVCD